MAFMSTVMASHFLSTNNQLRTSSNPRNQATIQDGRITVQQVQGRQGQSFTRTGNKGNATRFRGNNAASQARVVKCYNCQGEGHLVRQCTRLKRPRNSAWFKEKILLVQAQESGQTDDLDVYDSDCDDISSAKAVLMTNLSSYNSDVLSEVPQHDTSQNDNMLNQSVQEIQYFEQSLIDYVPDNEITKQPVVQTTHIRAEAPSELQKVSMVKTSFQKLKNHLASFDKVVKVRTTPDAITEGSWGFEHTKAVFKQEVIPFIKTLKDLFKDFDNGLYSELNEVKTVFNQMEAVVE
ncbi:retrovirus-related pol polyprotein from transposon TNT 1-94 [Tanacetum coccineum]